MTFHCKNYDINNDKCMSNFFLDNRLRQKVVRTLIPLLLIMAVLVLPTSLPASDYATSQLAAFAKSRPEAGAILDNSVEIYGSLAKVFSGMNTSVPLAWNPEEPQGNAYAENTPNTDRSLILIRVSSKLCALDQLSAFVYETMNAQNEASFAKLCQEAYAGSLSKTDFIYGILRLEHKSLKKTRAFLAQKKPFKDIDISQTEFYRKMFETPSDFDSFVQYLLRIKRKDFDIFDVYSQFYDFAAVMPFERRTR